MTTTDLARMDTNAVAVLATTTEAMGRLADWVAAASHAHALVAPLVGTPFIPEAYKPKVDDRATDEEKAAAREVAVASATAAVLQGITLGLDPMTALQQIYIVKGRPGLYTRIKVALVQAHGHEVWTEDLSDLRCVVAGRRKGTTTIERVTVTMDQAKRAGWTSNPSQAYTKTPQDMLYARAAGRVCDRIAADVLMGIASVEEIQDEIKTTAEAGNGHRTVTPRKRATPAAIEGTVEEPPLDADPAPAQTEPAPDPMTAAQGRKLYATLRDKGVGDKDLGLGYISDTLGREVGSTKELSKAEAKRVIDALEALAAPAPARDADPTLDEGAWPATRPAADAELEP